MAHLGLAAGSAAISRNRVPLRGRAAPPSFSSQAPPNMAHLGLAAGSTAIARNRVPLRGRATPPSFSIHLSYLAGRRQRHGDTRGPAESRRAPHITAHVHPGRGVGADGPGANGQCRRIIKQGTTTRRHSIRKARVTARTRPYNPAASLPPKVVKRLLNLEFIEMADLRGDIWPDDATVESSTAPRRMAKPPIISISTWLECYGRMAAILTSRFPEKAPELWAYQ